MSAPLPQNAGLDVYREMKDAERLRSFDCLLARYEEQLAETTWLRQAWLRWRGVADDAFRRAEDLRDELKASKRQAVIGWVLVIVLALTLAVR